MKKIIYAVIIFSFFMSCTSSKKVSNNDKSLQQEAIIDSMLIESNKWQLINFRGQTPAEAGFTRKIPFIKISKEEAHIGGHSGCNSFGGEVLIKGDTISFNRIISTKMYCIGVPEKEFFKILQQEMKFKIETGILIMKKDEITVLEFEKVK